MGPAISKGDSHSGTILPSGDDVTAESFAVIGDDDTVSHLDPAIRRLWEFPDDADLSTGAALFAGLGAQLNESSRKILAELRGGNSAAVLVRTDGRMVAVDTWPLNSAGGGRARLWRLKDHTSPKAPMDQRFQDFAEIASDYFWETTADGRFSYVSEHYEQVTGIPVSDIIGKTREEIWAQHAHSDIAVNAENIRLVEAMTTERKAYNAIQVDWRRKDGKDLVLSISGKPIFDAAGEFIGYRGVGTDVTEAARAEQLLRENEQKLRSLLEASPVGVSVVDHESNRRLFVNQTFVDMMRAESAEDLLGGFAKDSWVNAADRGKLMGMLDAGEPVVDQESRRQRLDGSEFWALMNSREIEFDGRPARMYWIMDITSRRETERILRENELRLRTILETSPLAFVVASRDSGKRVYANRAVARMFGVPSPEDVLNMDVGETWVDQEAFAESRRFFDAGGEMRDFEVKRRRLDGTEFFALINSRNVEFEGQPARVIWIADISDRVRADEEVRQSEQRLRAIMDASPIAFVVIDRDTRQRLFSNQAMADMLGLDSAEAVGEAETEDSWVSNDELMFVRSLLTAGTDLVNFECRRRRLGGSEITVLMNSRNLTFSGRESHAIWLTDISDRIDAEQRLRRSEGRLRELLDTSSVGVSVVSNVTGERLFANQRMAELFGAKTTEELVALPVAQSWADRDDYTRIDRLHRSGKIMVNVEARRCRLDGSEFWLLQNSNQIEFEGEDARVIWHNEITDMKAQQDELHAAKQMADMANRAKSEFLSSMSHELRTPLNAILGFGQVLQLDEDTPLTEAQNDNVDQIMRGGRHLLELIDQVLDLAKIESGSMELSIQSVPLFELLDDCREMVLGMAEEIQVSVDVSTAATPDLDVYADRTALRQVVLNLMSNAVKYNRSGGTVDVECRAVPGGLIRIAVADTGPGIPEDQWPEVFEPFSRLGAENSDIEGTGIGLTLSEQLVRQMGGHIGFDSEPGRGSVFWIDMPSVLEPVPMGAELRRDDQVDAISARKAPLGRDAVVLYVEDNAANLQLVELIFEHIGGFELLSAPTAELGLEIAETSVPDAILMDIRLPGMDGYEALRRLRENAATSEIPVIALSADAMPDNIARGRAAGFEDYLTKPINAGDVVNALNNAIAAHAADE